MSQITLEDFQLSSDDENHKDEHSAEANSVHDFIHESDEAADNCTDGDPYVHFSTDYEKFEWDEMQWSGIVNIRKHYKKTQRVNKYKMEVQDQAVKIPEEGEIYFNAAGTLWYTHKPDNVPISERAIFHHWIRPGLSEVENSKGTYAFSRERGKGCNDITCYNQVQEHWGLERPQYAHIMFEWERLGRRDPAYRLGNLYHQGLLVIDYWRAPVRAFQEIPLVISSKFEGGFMEPAMRLHSRLTYEDIRARMQPFIEVKKSDPPVFNSLPKANTLSARCRKFRESAGAISWDRREGSDRIKAFIEDIVKPIDNSTRTSRDLTEEEVNALRLVNHGTKPSRARAGTTKESKAKYIANTLKAAGVTPTTETRQEEEDEAEETQQEAGDTQPESDDKNGGTPQAEAEETQPETNDEVEENPQAETQGTRLEAENQVDEVEPVEAGEEEVEPSESQSHQEHSNRGWVVNYLLNYDALYRNDQDQFVENPLASED